MPFLFSCQEKHDPKRPEKIVRKRVVVIYDTLKPKAPAVIKDSSYLESIFQKHGLVNIQSLDSSILVKLRYADTSNFLKRDFYDGLRRAYFPCEVAISICNAQYLLKKHFPDYSLLIFDATRPHHVQQMMWDSLDMPLDRKPNYLADPGTISLHNYGCAVDLTIINSKTGNELDMGTDFDHFDKLAQPVYEWQFIKTGELSKEAFENRKLLRRLMQAVKLNPINTEWWHFNYCTKEFAAKNFVLIK